MGAGLHGLTRRGAPLHPSLPQDVQLQNAGAWANLTQAAAPAAPGAGSAPAQPAAPAAAAAAAEGVGAAPEDDVLWSEFQGREAQQLQAEEAKRAAEEEERKKKEAEMEAMQREAAEVGSGLGRHSGGSGRSFGGRTAAPEEATGRWVWCGLA